MGAGSVRGSEVKRFIAAVSMAALGALAAVNAQVPGRSVNMVAGTEWPGGDPFLQRQNEPSGAASTRNPLHLLFGANDYRTVDLPGLPEGRMSGDAWAGVFKSFNGGLTWQSTLLPGYPQDTSPEGMTSPLRAEGFDALADPVVRAGTNGLFYYAGIAFSRTAGSPSAVYMARFIDNNNLERGDPIAYLGTGLVALNGGGNDRFIDKPWIAVDIPRPGAGTCTIADQTFRAGNVYVAYTLADGEESEPTFNAHIYFTHSTDCGLTWSPAIQLSASTDQVNQGATIAVDPSSGDVYVAWRRFHIENSIPEEGIVVVRSVNRGRQFSAPGIVKRFLESKPLPKPFQQGGSATPSDPNDASLVSPMDQGTSPWTFRTNSYPTMTIDGGGRVYLAWSERGYGAARPDQVSGDARVLITTSRNGTSWSEATPVDNAPQAGHQLMPSLTFGAGKLTLMYYDLRDDVSQVFERFVDERDAIAMANRRHTLDVRVTQADPGASPAFSPSVPLSDYAMGSRPGSLVVEQLQYNPPNLKLFRLGTVAFMGDYIDVVPGPPFVPQGTGWVANTTTGTGSPMFHAAWTDNRDVRPPLDGDWTNYTPPTSAFHVGGGTSLFDPTVTSPQCVPGQAGMRNQNIYGARISSGLVAGSPGNAKPLDADLQRAFVVFAQNATDVLKTFRLTILSQPTGGRASFVAYPLPPFPPNAPPPVTTLDVQIGPRSSIARSVFVTSTDPDARVNIAVQEITALGGGLVAAGLSSTVLLNPDISNPDISNPDISNPDISNNEVYNPDISNPDISNPDISNPDISNPDISNPDISNKEVMNPDISNPDISNPDISNPDISNPDISNPDISNPDISNGSVTDVTWTITNDGNTAAAYDINLLLTSGAVPAGIKTQLILHRVYLTPVADACALKTTTQNVVSANIPNPVFVTDSGQLFVSDPQNGAVTNATLWLQPGESAKITLRVVDPDPTDGVTLDPITEVTPAVVAQGVNNGTEVPPAGEVQPVAAPPLPSDSGSLQFVVQPTNAAPGALMTAVQVLARDPVGAVLPGIPVTLALFNNPGSGTLSGTLTVLTDATGIATFGDLRVDRVGVGYTLAASASGSGAHPTTSASFTILVGCFAEPAGLAHWWPANGNAIDVRGGHSGTLMGNATFAAGKVGQAFQLDGAGDFVDVGPGINLDAMTLSAWVFIDPLTNVNDVRVISKDNQLSGGLRKEFSLKSSNSLDVNGHPSFEVLIEDQGFEIVRSPSPLSAGWHHLAAVRDVAANRFELYVDGVLVASQVPTIVGPIDSAVNAVIGAVNPTLGTEFFTGLIDEAQIFDRALSTVEIQGIYNSNEFGICAGPTFVITTTADTGTGTLRQAVIEANAVPFALPPPLIAFGIPSPGPHTIGLLTPLPTVTRSAIIDGRTQTGYAGAPVILIDGASAGVTANGLMFIGGSSQVRGLAMGNFGGSGIVLQSSSGYRIAGNYLGTNLSGSAPLDIGTAIPAETIGGDVILILDSSNNVIGGTAGTTPGGPCTGDCNVLVARGNNKGGVRVDGVTSDGNQVLGNFIGTDAAGNVGMGAGNSFGVIFYNTASGTIGDGTPAGRNLISGYNTGVSVSASGLSIRGNYIGTNAAGTAAPPNNFGGFNNINFGIQITGANHLIEGNLLSGNSTGLSIVSGNSIARGNWIGLNAAGTGAVPNGWGVLLSNIANNNVVGGTTAAERNVISGNLEYGVAFGAGDPTVTGNRVIGNYIGTNPAGDAAIPNGSDGVNLDNVFGNFIGGLMPGEGNVISGNSLSGINIRLGADATSVLGNIIGLNAAGTAAIGNGLHGVTIVEDGGTVDDTIVGGSAAAARNIISGNASWGIVDRNGTDTLIQGNFIGTDATGTVAIGNVAGGIDLFGSGAIVGNIVSGSLAGTAVGILLGGGPSLVTGNRVGLDSTGLVALPNASAGIWVISAGHTIGGTAGAGNVVSGNLGDGILLEGAGASGNSVLGNFIGTDAAGAQAIANGIDGIQIDGAPGNLVGGALPGEGNVISSNLRHGIHIRHPISTSTVIQGNIIGLDASGTVDRGNASDGIRTFNAGAQIGGTQPGARNIISSNSSGIVFSNSGSTFTTNIQGNYIGTDITGALDRGNGIGVSVGSAPGTQVGGSAAGAGNVISGNQTGVLIVNTSNALVQGNIIGLNAGGTGPLGNAVGVRITSGTGNSVLDNVISANSGLGIDIGGAGVTANDAGDPDAGANNLQNFPVVTSATTIEVHGTLNSTANTAFTIQLFANSACDASGFGEGHTLLGAVPVTTDGGGDASFTFGASLTAGQYVTATATEAGGSTSEFSACVVVPASLVVTTVADSGAGSLRQAILDANASPDPSAIVFDIPGAGPHNLLPATPLPTITAPVQIDGLSQPGASPGTPMIELRGSAGLGIGVSGLTVAGGGSLVRGLVINGFPGPGMTISSSGNTIRSNFIGTNVTGTSAIANAQGIVLGSGAASNVIGGDLSDHRNVIGGNSEWGIAIEGDANTISGNVIGVDGASGLGAANGSGGTSAGIMLLGGAINNVIGGQSGGLAPNIISGNNGTGITLSGGGIGGVGPAGSGNAIRSNQIDGNTGLGIDLGADGITANDVLDADSGPNGLQNYPGVSTPTTSSVSGELFSAPDLDYTVQFFASDTSNRQGRTVVATDFVHTDGAGHAFIGPLPVTLTSGQWVTATATDPGGNTSEFSAAVQVP